MRTRRLAVNDWIVDQLGSISPAQLALAAKQKWPNLEFIPALESIGVRGTKSDPTPLLANLHPLASSPKRHVIPVCFERGVDLSDLGFTPGTVAELFTDTELTIAAIGFQPGFPYMTGLPAALSGFERRTEPRTHVPRGAVAVARDMIGIYPAELPGGWNIIGQTPLTICDPATDFFPLSAGDIVTLEAITVAEFEAREGERLAD